MHRLAVCVICSLASVSPSVSQDALGSALADRLSQAALSDGMPELRLFSFESNIDLFANPHLSADEVEPYRAMIVGQLSQRVTSANLDFLVLRLEACGNNLGIYGIPEWAAASGNLPAGLLDQVRVNSALASAGLDVQLTNSEAASLRAFQDTGVEIAGVPVPDFPLLRSLNERLFDLNETGGTQALHQIIDPSWGCGAGEIEVEIRSDPPLTEIHMIPELYFSVCEDVTPDPWDKSQCRWWTPSPEVGMVSGTYAYQGVTSEGETRRGKINIDLREASDSLEKPVVILR